jgi:hypothetical protein
MLEEHRGFADWIAMIQDKHAETEIERAVKIAHGRLKGNAMLVAMFVFWRTWQQRTAIARGNLSLAGLTPLQQLLLTVGLSNCVPWTPPRMRDSSALPPDKCIPGTKPRRVDSQTIPKAQIEVDDSGHAAPGTLEGR